MEALADSPDALVQEHAVKHRLEDAILNTDAEIVKCRRQSSAATVVDDVVANHIAHLIHGVSA